MPQLELLQFLHPVLHATEFLLLPTLDPMLDIDLLVRLQLELLNFLHPVIEATNFLLLVLLDVLKVLLKVELLKVLLEVLNFPMLEVDLPLILTKLTLELADFFLDILLDATPLTPPSLHEL